MTFRSELQTSAFSRPRNPKLHLLCDFSCAFPPVHEEVVVAPANANVLPFARLFRWELVDGGVCLSRGDCDHPAALGSSSFALLFVGLFWC